MDRRRRRPPSAARRSATSAVAALLLLTACGSSARFVDQEADIAYYERVAVAPFMSLSQDQLAGQKVADIFFAELLETGFAQVVEPGQLLAAMIKARGGTPLTNPWSTEEIAKLGAEIGIQGIFMGTVRDYRMEQVGRDSFPHVSLEIRFVDATSGRIVWTADQTRRGGPGVPILGTGEIHTLGELTSDMCSEMLDSLPQGE
jgi:hypothetical protein